MSKIFSVVLAFTVLPVLMTAGCSKKEEQSAEYQAACQGPSLRKIENRQKAMEDGYAINRKYDCIDKASYEFIRQERARWEAANTPEAIAQRAAETAQQQARYAQKVQEERESAARERVATETVPDIVLRDVDVNTATEAEIADVISVGPEVAAQIISERNKRPFAGWDDLVSRVTGLSAAQTAVYASVCGLKVSGQSLAGAEPNATLAAAIYKKYQQYRAK